MDMVESVEQIEKVPLKVMLFHGKFTVRFWNESAHPYVIKREDSIRIILKYWWVRDQEFERLPAVNPKGGFGNKKVSGLNWWIRDFLSDLVYDEQNCIHSMFFQCFLHLIYLTSGNSCLNCTFKTVWKERIRYCTLNLLFFITTISQIFLREK
jgi:hypothetical protein